MIKQEYRELKQKIGKIPTLMDFDKYNAIDPLRFFENKNLKSYYGFLNKYESEYTIELNSIEKLFIEFISKKLASGKRPHELLLLKSILNNDYKLIAMLSKNLKENYNINLSLIARENVINVLTNKFLTGQDKKTYDKCVFIQKQDDDYIVSKEFYNLLKNKDFKDMVSELIEFGLNRYNKNYSKRYKDTSFQLYQKYTYEDVCRLLEWEKGEVALNIGGYKFDKKTKTYPVFINYDKHETIEDSINYEDRLLSECQLIAISKSGRTKKSDDVVQIYNAEKNNVNMYLFIRKNKDDKISKEFYFLGKIKAFGESKEFVMKNTTKTAVEIKYQLLTPIRSDIYDYIIS